MFLILTRCAFRKSLETYDIYLNKLENEIELKDLLAEMQDKGLDRLDHQFTAIINRAHYRFLPPLSFFNKDKDENIDNVG